jgi:hypothetical protein
MILIMTCFCQAEEKTWKINKPLSEVVEAARQNLENFEKGDLDLSQFGVITDVDLEMRVTARPKIHYYRFDVNLESPIRRLNGFSKSLEVWGKPGETIVHSTVNIDFGKTHKFPLKIVDCVRDRVLTMIERKLLELEEKEIRKLINE